MGSPAGDEFEAVAGPVFPVSETKKNLVDEFVVGFWGRDEEKSTHDVC